MNFVILYIATSHLWVHIELLIFDVFDLFVTHQLNKTCSGTTFFQIFLQIYWCEFLYLFVVYIQYKHIFVY